MKKKKKDNFTKTMTWLVFLTVVITAFFLMVNYVTNQQLSLNSQAASSKCEAYKIKEGKIEECADIKTEYKDQRDFIPCEPDKGKKNGYFYCKAGSVSSKGKDCKQAGKEIGGSGKADWYKETAGELSNKWANKKYIVKVTDVTSLVGPFYQNQHPDRNCLKVGSRTPMLSCSDMKGEWYKTSSCYNLNDPDNPEYIYKQVVALSVDEFSDYKYGSVCCTKEKVN